MSAIAAGLLALALLLAAGLAKGLRYPRYPVRPPPGRFPADPSPGELDRIVEGLMAQMSPAEKLDQLSGDLSPMRFNLRAGANLIAGRRMPLIYSGRNERLGIPPLAFTDGPRGVNVGRGRTAFPVTMARGASWDPALERRIGEAMGREIRAAGGNYSGAVCVNLLRHPGWGRAQETYGEDPHHLGAMGLALTRGLQAHNVMACVKHFAANSIENSRFYVDVQIDEVALRELYLPHFRAITRECASVMSAYNKLRGEHCGHSRALLEGILREEWGFEGFVTSDWIHGVRDGAAGLRAGMDVEMPARHRYGAPLERALAAGEARWEDVDRSVRRILKTRMRFALATDPEDYPPSSIACEAHAALAREAAEQSAVLLKNEDGALPLTIQPGEGGAPRIAVIGRLASSEDTGDRGSSHVMAPYVISPLQGLREAIEARGGEVLHSDGADAGAARSLAAQADAVIALVGYTWREEGEYFVMNPDRREAAWQPPFFGGGGDRAAIDLPARDRALLEAIAPTSRKLIAVYVGGSAIEIHSWRDRADAILFAFYGGQEGGRALARLLLGEVSPSGKLPFTLFEDPSDLPAFEPHAETARYDAWHGYLLAERRGLPVAYPFGHGLSYASFRCGPPSVDASSLRAGAAPREARGGREDCEGVLIATIEVENVSDRPGAEVVQLYVGPAEPPPDRPLKRLRGFQKLTLAPGERREVRLEVRARALARYDVDAGGWRLDAGTYVAHLGTSSDPRALSSVPFSIA